MVLQLETLTNNNMKVRQKTGFRLFPLVLHGYDFLSETMRNGQIAEMLIDIPWFCKGVIPLGRQCVFDKLKGLACNCGNNVLVLLFVKFW